MRKPGDLHRPEQLPIKNTLIFRAFDDVMREIKNPTENWSVDTTPDYAHVLVGEDTADPDQYAEVFLVGRTVLGDFITHDAAFSAQFDLTARLDLRTACDRVLVRFMERESCGHASRHAATNRQEGGA